MATTLDTLQTPEQQSYNKVIHTYETLHKLFFGLGMSLFTVIVSIIVATMVINSPAQYELRDKANTSTEKELLSGMQNSIRKYDKHPSVRLFIKQGPLLVNNSAIQTIDNLVTYKGFVMPRGISIDPNIVIQGIDYFSQTGYAEVELENYLKTIVLTSSKDLSVVDENSIRLLSPGSSLYYYFGINCLQEQKLITNFCEGAVQEMLDSMPAYNIGKDYDSLKSISEHLTATSFQGQFCDNVRQYLFFSNDTSESIKAVMHTCGEEYEQSYNDFAGFRTIQEQLDKQFINSIVTPSALLNAYILVSTQQIIYNELSVGKFNELRIKSYAKYVEELLRRNKDLQSFYFDSIAVYNNKYLLPELTKLFLKSRSQDKAIKDLLENFRLINEGNSLVGYNGLVSFISNPNLVGVSSITIISSSAQEKTLDTLFRETNSFSNFLVSSVSLLSGDRVEVKGSFRSESSTSNNIVNKLQSVLIMTYNGQRFTVVDMSFPNYPILTQNMSALFDDKALTLPGLYDELSQNGSRLNTSVKTICELIKDSPLIVSCSNKVIVVRSKVLSGNVTYTINHSSGSLLSYMISQSSWQEQMIKELGVPTTTDSSLALFINTLANYSPAVSEIPITKNTDPKTITGTAQILQVREDFSNLGAKVTDVSLVGSLYSVQFSLQNINFIAAYDLSKQTILGAAVVTTTKTTIRNFVLNLSNPNAQDVIFFSTDPKAFITQKDAVTAKRLFN